MLLSSVDSIFTLFTYVTHGGCLFQDMLPQANLINQYALNLKANISETCFAIFSR